ncbi:hypothetical protein SDC9_177604 [bioreactor metagenome]|uniref:Uncharacterized protein n=1 Tax=bioreactor metagenome TaxID=1076179 RepID=A0A645GV60_9ZZZZ
MVVIKGIMQRIMKHRIDNDIIAHPVAASCLRDEIRNIRHTLHPNSSPNLYLAQSDLLGQNFHTPKR